MSCKLVDPLSSEYICLLSCPFLRKDQVTAVVRKEYGSKAEDREDLKEIIESEWVEVGDFFLLILRP